MVITVEPGLYIEQLGFGIRLEDDVLVTKDGSENLSKEILIKPDDIEKFMAK
jgi:Xaa-Pro aminopeptidase